MKKRENGYAGRDTGELDSANRPCVCGGGRCVCAGDRGDVCDKGRVITRVI